MKTRLKKDLETLYNYNKKMTTDNYQEILSNMYRYIKRITPKYFKEGVDNNDYEEIKLDIMLTEERIKQLKIIDVPVYFDYENEPKELIENIVYKTRAYLLNEHCYFEYRKGIIDIDFTEDCLKASEYVKNICDSKKQECSIIGLFPGFCDEYNLFGGSGKHFANILKYNNDYYLIDVTYSQFFYSRRNNLERLGIYDLSGCAPGIFMLMSKEREETAISLIQNGYLKLDKENFKHYMDGFALSYRNGSFYEETNDFTYTTNYSSNDYINFIEKKDNQVNYEGKENLGFQKKLMKNPSLRFKK